MARIVHVSDQSHLAGVLYHRPQEVIDRQERRARELSSRKGNLSRYEESLLSRFKNVNSSRRRAETLMSTIRMRQAGRVDVISMLEGVRSFQTASAHMEDFIMANPRVRDLYQRNKVEGYANTYRKRDENRNAIGHSHSVYREVQNEVVVKEGDEFWAYTYVGEAQKDLLSKSERSYIRQCWSQVDDILDAKMEDPTSQYNALL